MSHAGCPSEPGEGEAAEALLTEANARLSLLEANLPESVDGFAISPKSKLPFKALWYRDALLWRTTQMGRSAAECFERNKLASAVLLTRATVETCAAVWYLQKKIEMTIASGTVGNVDDDLMRLLMGSKVDTDILPPSVNVLNFVDRVDRDIPGFRHQYDRLSEIAHPNWAGTVFLFSKTESGGIANFGEHSRSADHAKKIGLPNLTVALSILERFLNGECLYPQEWNDFVECSHPDKLLDTYRKRCDLLDPLVNCSGPQDQKAVEELRTIVQELRRLSALGRSRYP
jgi:hypothetical protein